MKNDLKKLTDEELYSRFYGKKSVARAAFDEIYRRYSSKIYTYCSRIIGDSELAEDVFQEAFLKFYESSNVQRDMTNVSAYLFRIARNLCINEKQRKHHSFISLEDVSFSLADKSVDKTERAELVNTALEALPKMYREVLVLKEFLGFSYSEIADILETTLPSVRIRIYRAKQKIKELLTPYINDLKDEN